MGIQSAMVFMVVKLKELEFKPSVNDFPRDTVFQ